MAEVKQGRWSLVHLQGMMMSIVYVSVNRRILANNHKTGRKDPPYEVRTSKTDTTPKRQTTLVISNAKNVVFQYQPGAPLVSGAVCWVEVTT